jgi:hypothetical protein
LNSGFIGELVTGWVLSLTLEVDIINDDAGRRSEFANALEVPLATVADEARDGAGDALGVAAGKLSSLEVMRSPRSCMIAMVLLKS